ncbi:hypothetical protein BCR33DRAFT_673482, partial [Rhizoclosmatium globosum]
PRRLTGSQLTPVQIAEQERLHNIVLENLAVLIADGMPLEYLIGLDEFGAHLFPQGAWKWERKGAQHVESLVKRDKRQYTGDLVINAAGEIIILEQIFMGKTKACLPSKEIRDQFPQFQFNYSHNHWANHHTKVALMKRIYSWVITHYSHVNQCSEKEAQAQKPTCAVLLDCWPVNLTEIFRDEVKEHCPGMILFFIAAGATGLYQV